MKNNLVAVNKDKLAKLIKSNEAMKKKLKGSAKIVKKAKPKVKAVPKPVKEDYRVTRDRIPSLVLSELRAFKRIWDGNVKEGEVEPEIIEALKSRGLIFLEKQPGTWRPDKKDPSSFGDYRDIQDLIIQREDARARLSIKKARAGGV